jgi:beta-glucosidase
METRGPKSGGLPPLSRMQDSDFIWATGIEDTFITAPNPKTGRTLEEYELTQHYERWEDDFDLAQSLGVRAMRYGIPWYKVQPSATTWDWNWPDQTLDGLAERGIDPIIDLVHYGVPAWLEKSLLDPDFPQRMAEYGARFAERYKGRVHWYTPLNEPRINAWYAGKLGWWPPYRKGWPGFAQILVKLSEGIVRTTTELRRIDPEIVICHVDASDIYFSDDPTLHEEVVFRQRLVLLSLDLLTGLIRQEPAMSQWLLKQGITEEDLDWFTHDPEPPDVVGFNMYPIFSNKEMHKAQGKRKFRVKYGTRHLVEDIGRMYWERYGIPLMLSETATNGSPQKRIDWLHESMAGVRSLRNSGVPVLGYTWWPLFALVSWPYRQGLKDISHYIVQMGLWDLDSDLNRVETPAAEEFRRVVFEGASSAGTLEMERRLSAV